MAADRFVFRLIVAFWFTDFCEFLVVQQFEFLEDDFGFVVEFAARVVDGFDVFGDVSSN